MSQLTLPMAAYSRAEIESWRNKGFLLRLMALIVSHDNGAEHCYACNAYIARKLRCSPDSVTRGVERLVKLGVIQLVEHAVGVLRRLAALRTVGELRRLLWPTSRPTPAQRARQRASHSYSHSPAGAPSANFFSPLVAEGSADTVAEGLIKRLLRSLTQMHLRCKEQTTGKRARECPFLPPRSILLLPLR